MKKVLILIIGVFLFGASNEEINKKLDMLLNMVIELKKEVSKKDKEIAKLKEELQKQKKETKEKFAIKSCNLLKVSKFSWEFKDEVIPFYELEITLTNEYPKEIKFIRGSLIVEDKDRVEILQDFIDRSVKIPPKGSIEIEKKHLINAEIEMSLKDEKPQNLKVYFVPTRIEFSDGSKLECN